MLGHTWLFLDSFLLCLGGYAGVGDQTLKFHLNMSSVGSGMVGAGDTLERQQDFVLSGSLCAAFGCLGLLWNLPYQVREHSGSVCACLYPAHLTSVWDFI